MAKMREFLFWNEKGQEEKKENTSFKKAVKSVQENFKNQLIGFEYISKKGKKIVDSVKIPVGRKIRQSIEIEKRRAKERAEREQRQAEAKQRYGS